MKSLLSGLADGWVSRSSEILLLVLSSHLLVPRRRGRAPCWAGQHSLTCAWDPGVGSETDLRLPVMKKSWRLTGEAGMQIASWGHNRGLVAIHLILDSSTISVFLSLKRLFSDTKISSGGINISDMLVFIVYDGFPQVEITARPLQ